MLSIDFYNMTKFYNNQLGVYYCSVCNKKIKKEMMNEHNNKTHTKGYISFT